jgi:tetratricopeptide (TPR) repeat protein
MSGSRGSSAVSAVLLGGALGGVAFGAAGGTALGRTVTVEIAMVVVGGLLVAAGVLLGRRPLHGAGALLAFAALAALTALSIVWSAVPELAYVEAGRTLAYLATFAAAIAAARAVPSAGPAVVQGVLLAASAVVAYSLASRIWPGTLAEYELSNRIGAPYQYWNAVGSTAAMIVPAALWLGSRRAGGAVSRALAYPALGAAILAILLTQSRGALLAAAIGAAAWFAIVPLRLRSLPVLLAPAAGAGAVGAWALSKDAFSKSLQPLEAKQAVADDFGLLVLLLVLVLFAVGLAVDTGRAREVVPARWRRRVGAGAIAVACLVPLVALTSVAFSDRGLSGTISDRVDELTSETETAPGEGAERLSAASSTRGKYWREAGKVFAERRTIGTGAGNFQTTRLRFRTDATVTKHAHGYVVQTLADLGLAGVALSAALLVAWLVAAARATALFPARFARGDPPPRRDWTGNRIALVALVLIAVVFGVQSTIDWTWFVPGPAAMAFVAAGFAAGHGPFAATGELVLERPGRGRIAIAAGVVVAALLAAWAIWQPEAASRATGEALEQADVRDFDTAIAKTEDAEDSNPLSAEPLLVRAAIETRAGREQDARATLERAVLRFPGDPQTWLRLASFELGTMDRPDRAVEIIRGAIYLNPRHGPSAQVYLDARARLREKETRGG